MLALGRIEGQLIGINDTASRAQAMALNHEERISSLEKWKSRLTGIWVAIATGAVVLSNLVWNYLGLRG